MSEMLVRVDRVSKKFCRSLRRSLWYGMRDLGNELRGHAHAAHDRLRPDEFWAVRDIDFELRRGECLGVIGHNGAGKTTMLRMLNGLLKLDAGRIELHGRVGALIALGAGFHPLLTGRENIYVNAAILGATRAEVNRNLEAIVEFSGLAEHIDSPVQYYSSGMYVRLGFAIAAHVRPDILLVDEALAVGDVAYIMKCLNRIAELRRDGTGVIFVSHNELQVREAAQRCLVLSHGQLLHDGDLDAAFAAYEQSRVAGEPTDVGFVHDGPIRVGLCKLGASAPGPRVGDSLRIEVRCRASEAVTDAAFHLRFWNSAGQIVTSIDSAALNTPVEVPAGDFVMTAEIPSLALVPGRYRLAGGFIRHGEFLGWARDLAHFEVALPQGFAVTEGFFATRASFTVSPGTGSA